MTQVWIALETTMMAYAVILLAVVLLTIASLTDALIQHSLLLCPCLDRFFRIIILAAMALTHAGYACTASLTADAVELAALASLAITMLRLTRITRSGL